MYTKPSSFIALPFNGQESWLLTKNFLWFEIRQLQKRLLIPRIIQRNKSRRRNKTDKTKGGRGLSDWIKSMLELPNGELMSLGRANLKFPWHQPSKLQPQNRGFQLPRCWLDLHYLTSIYSTKLHFIIFSNQKEKNSKLL